MTRSAPDLPTASDFPPPPPMGRPGWARGLWPAVAWLIFPLVPTLAGTLSYEVLNISFFERSGPDPYDWDWSKWLLLTGPLLGYGFLAGMTLGLPDDPSRRGIRGWPARRSLWVGVGPWIGFLSAAAVFYAGSLVASGVSRAFPEGLGWTGVSFPQWLSEWLGWIAQWALGAWLAYGWLVVARAAIGRARRLDRLGQSIARGLIASIGFVGSLFGSFWAITASWRSYFFDARIVPFLVASAGLLMMSGCGGTITYGEVRRRELFGAMLTAWLLGLALAWRWWSRPRSKPPTSS